MLPAAAVADQLLASCFQQKWPYDGEDCYNSTDYFCK